MPVNGYTVGRDVTVTISGAGGNNIIISSDQVTHFEARPVKRQDWARPLNLPPRPLYMPDGWQGTFEVDRADATLDSYQADLESEFWNGQNILAGTLLETITEDDGSVTQYQFDGVMYWVEEPGAFRVDGIVRQRVEFCAGRRRRTS